MLCDHAMVDAIEPILPTAEDEVDVGTEPFGHVGGAAISGRMMIIAAYPKTAIAAAIVGDDQRAWHDGALDEAAHRNSAAVGTDTNSHARTA